MVTTFDDIMRRRIKEHLLNGNLDQVQAAKTFLRQSNQDFGSYLKPLFETPDIPKKKHRKEEPKTNPKTSRRNRHCSTWWLQYSWRSKTKPFTKAGVSEYKTIGFEHGDHIQFKEN